MPLVLVELAGLPQLQSLEMLDWDVTATIDTYDRVEPVCYDASSWFTCVSSLSVTRLSVQMPLHGWDDGAIAALATALPQLQALHLAFPSSNSTRRHVGLPWVRVLGAVVSGQDRPDLPAAG